MLSTSRRRILLRALFIWVPLAVLSACRPPAPSPPAKPRVLFVGLDGASWTVIARLLERGELPAFRRLTTEGTYAPHLDTLDVTLSPVVWTTIATGRAPEDHGVVSFTSELANGTKIPVTSSVRKARAIWELATKRGVSVGVIGWWASWPAEEVNGYVVSDHANPAFADFLFDDRNYWTADRATLAKLRRDFLPLDIGPILARHWLTKEAFPYADLQRRGGFSDAQIAELRRAPWSERNVYSWLKTFYRVDLPLFRASRDLARERPTDLQMLYLRGPDPVQHYGWDLVEPERYLHPPAHLDRDRGLIEGVYRYLDTFLGEILAEKPADSWLIVASDHGAEPSVDAMSPAMKRPGEHGPNAKGVLFIVGPGVRPGRQITASVYDLMPTMAWLLGLPLSAELPGKPLAAAFDDGFVKAHPAAHVPSYGPRPTGPLLPSSSDAEMIKSLKNLGYIQ